jgi:hypothetical protein
MPTATRVRRVRSQLGTTRVSEFAAEPTLVAYPADRKLIPFGEQDLASQRLRSH